MVETTIVESALSLPANFLRETFLEVDLPTCHCGAPFRKVLSERMPPTTEHVTKTLGPNLHVIRCLRVPPEATLGPHMDRRDDKVIQRICFPFSLQG